MKNRKDIQTLLKKIELLVEIFGNKPNIGLRFYNGHLDIPIYAELLRHNGKGLELDLSVLQQKYEESINVELCIYERWGEEWLKIWVE